MVERATQLDAPIAAVDTSSDARSYVDWAAIFAGALLAAAIAFVLLTFGTAIGLTLASPFKGEGVSGTAVAVAISLWVLWAEISSFIAGGYLTGRLRRRVPGATEHEVEVRDAGHGLVVWAVGTLIGALLAASALSGIAKGGAEAARAAGSSAMASITAGATQGADPWAYVADKLLRSNAQASNNVDPRAARAEVVRILAAGTATAGIAPDDKAYLAQLVAARTGLAQSEAETRVNDVLARTEAAIKTAADKARKVSVLLAFLTAASSLASAAAASWAARLGGRHRDQGTAFRFSGPRR